MTQPFTPPQKSNQDAQVPLPADHFLQKLSPSWSKDTAHLNTNVLVSDQRKTLLNEIHSFIFSSPLVIIENFALPPLHACPLPAVFFSVAGWLKLKESSLVAVRDGGRPLASFAPTLTAESFDVPLRSSPVDPRDKSIAQSVISTILQHEAIKTNKNPQGIAERPRDFFLEAAPSKNTRSRSPFFNVAPFHQDAKTPFTSGRSIFSPTFLKALALVCPPEAMFAPTRVRAVRFNRLSEIRFALSTMAKNPQKYPAGSREYFDVLRAVIHLSRAFRTFAEDLGAAYAVNRPDFPTFFKTASYRRMSINEVEYLANVLGAVAEHVFASHPQHDGEDGAKAIIAGITPFTSYADLEALHSRAPLAPFPQLNEVDEKLFQDALMLSIKAVETCKLTLVTLNILFPFYHYLIAESVYPPFVPANLNGFGPSLRKKETLSIVQAEPSKAGANPDDLTPSSTNG